MNKIEFTTKLKGDDVEIINMNLKDNEHIIFKECTVKWSIEPNIYPSSIKWWNLQLNGFNCEIEIEDIDERKPEKRQFDEKAENYILTIDSSNYRFKDEFVVSRIFIDRFDKTVLAIIQ